jgi:hypothetical protein
MRDDPFAKLGALDQKLFTKPSPPPAANSVGLPNSRSPINGAETTAGEQGVWQPTSSTEKEVEKEGSREVGKLGKRQASQPNGRLHSMAFDLNVKPYRKDSYLFTNEEFEALEDLKIELRRSYDVKVSKNDLARCAIGQLLADFRRNPGRSAVVRELLATR